MATLLVNPKMNPALAARIEASVSGRKGRRTASHVTARWTSWVRIGLVVGVAWLAVSILLSVRRERAELAHARASLLARWREQSVSLTPKERTFLERVDRALATLRGSAPGEVITAEVRAAGGLLKVLGRPAVYLRGPVALLDGTAGAVTRAAADSGKDTLLLCLLDPPSGRDEKTLLTKARLALGGGTSLAEQTQNVLRLHDAEVGLPVLLDPWSERIKAARDGQALSRVERDFKRTPIGAAKRALRSELLIAVLDEPTDKASITELDGEAPHMVRLAIVELDSARTLLSIRRHVDPNWISPRRRPQYARELDGCRFAIDVHEAVHDSGAR